MKLEDPGVRPRRFPTVWVVAAGVGLLAVAVYLAWPWLSTFTDPSRARRLVEDAGPWGPLVLIAMQVVQVLIAPIPGQITGLVGGFLFGPVLGVVYTVIGSTIGFTLIFLLARKLGRPFVERFVSPSFMERFDHLAGTRGTLALFLVFLLPVFPDDLISFAAGLTRIPIRTLIVISVLGRLPGYILLSLGGDGLATENLNPVIVIAVAMVIAFVVAYWKRVWLTEMVESGDVVGFLRRRWTLSGWATILLVLGVVAVLVLFYMAATVTPVLP